MKKFKLTGKDMVLSFQHMFAMLGSTIIVPILAGMSIPMTLIGAGVGTILFYFISKRKVPVFLGSSFAFLPALIVIIGRGKPHDMLLSEWMYSPQWNANSLAVMLALVCAGLVYVILAIVIKFVGVDRIKKLFPPVVVGPIIIIIGMILAPKMFWNNIILPSDNVLMGNLAIKPWQAWSTAIVTAVTIIGVNSYAKPKSFLKVIPILLGFIVGYIYSACIGIISFEDRFSASNIIVFQNIGKYFGFWGAWKDLDGGLVGTAMLSIVPIALVTFMEHLGDIAANSTVCNQDFMVDPGLHRTVLGDGVATMVSGLIGGPANTTYGENTAVLSITKNYNPQNIFIAALLAIFFGVFSVFSDFLATIPSPVIGGASIVLFGMIAGNGLRALIDARVDFNNSKNMMIVATVLSVGLGLGAMSLAGDIMGMVHGGNESVHMPALKIMAGPVEISPLAIATLLAIVLNLIIPNKKEETQEEPIVTLTSAAAVDMSDYNQGKKSEDELVNDELAKEDIEVIEDTSQDEKVKEDAQLDDNVKEAKTDESQDEVKDKVEDGDNKDDKEA